ncbi:hypothetical protein PMG71_07335 [Roseofilum sp. BLCC_M154]|uniref:Transposase n=1 Tax=Roseofilum acuticapitatum BLCC-M154 TaxID=3022444 RepID=A0ABT7AS28_9CYAN|nr:hypothetical protein [Roseofilum acuticapitatum]MDJ1169234.1 hypothetical protein [Roseofilum acuticapitatum BLCC-M154]
MIRPVDLQGFERQGWALVIGHVSRIADRQSAVGTPLHQCLDSPRERV